MPSRPSPSRGVLCPFATPRAAAAAGEREGGVRRARWPSKWPLTGSRRPPSPGRPGDWWCPLPPERKKVPNLERLADREHRVARETLVDEHASDAHHGGAAVV